MAKLGSEPDPLITRSQAPSAVTQNGAVSAAAAAANTVVADTGALPAGDYAVEFSAAVLGVAVAGVGLIVEHRNAANSGNITVLGGCAGGGDVTRSIPRVTLALNERIRIRVDAVALPASTVAVAAVRASKLP